MPAANLIVPPKRNSETAKRRKGRKQGRRPNRNYFPPKEKEVDGEVDVSALLSSVLKALASSAPVPEGEIETLGYPKAALFGFCMALVTYNLLSVVRAAVHAVHGEEAADNLSIYYVSNEVAGIHLGMSVILDGEFWRNKYSHFTPKQMAAELKRVAGKMKLSKYQKGKWTPSKKPKKKMNKKHRGHKSTFRILENARKKAAKAA